MSVFAVFEIWKYEGEELISLHQTQDGADAKVEAVWALHPTGKEFGLSFEIREMVVNL